MQLLRILAFASLAVMVSSTASAIGFDEVKATDAEETRAIAHALLLPVSGSGMVPNPPLPEYLAPGAPTNHGGSDTPSVAPAPASAAPATPSSKPTPLSPVTGTGAKKPVAAAAAPAAAPKAGTPVISPTPAKPGKKNSVDDELLNAANTADDDEATPAKERSMDDELLDAANAADDDEPLDASSSENN